MKRTCDNCKALEFNIFTGAGFCLLKYPISKIKIDICAFKTTGYRAIPEKQCPKPLSIKKYVALAMADQRA